MLRLLDIVRRIGELDQEATLYAAQPWSADSRVVIAVEPDDGRTPQEAERQGCVYFIEVSIAADFLESWRSMQRAHPSDHDACARLIQYARNDA